MSPRKQAGNPLSREIIKKMIDRGLTWTALAKRINRPRESVSRAVHHAKHPKVLREVRKELGV